MHPTVRETTETPIGNDFAGTVYVPAYTRTSAQCRAHHGVIVSDDCSARGATIAALVLPGLSEGREVVLAAVAAPGSIPDDLLPYLTALAVDNPDGWEQLITLSWEIMQARAKAWPARNSTEDPGAWGWWEAWQHPTPTDPLITLVIDDSALILASLSDQHRRRLFEIAEHGGALGMRLIHGLADGDTLISDFWQRHLHWAITEFDLDAHAVGAMENGKVLVSVADRSTSIDATLHTPSPEDLAGVAVGYVAVGPHVTTWTDPEVHWALAAQWSPESSRTTAAGTAERRPLRVPAALRPWDVDWPGYDPVDITPDELRPLGTLDQSVQDGWAEPTTEPTELELQARRQDALISWDIVDGHPRNPAGRTGRIGRNLGRWGENQAADPIVAAGSGPSCSMLLVRRGDCGDWAIPGGMVEPGELAPAALVRELREETGVDLQDLEPLILERTYIEDPRNTDWAWVASTSALYRLPVTVPVYGDGDPDGEVLEAAWWPFLDVEHLQELITAAGGRLYTAHLPLLRTAAHVLHRSDSIHAQAQHPDELAETAGEAK